MKDIMVCARSPLSTVANLHQHERGCTDHSVMKNTMARARSSLSAVVDRHQHERG